MERLLKVPLLDLQPQYAEIRADVLAAIARVCDSQQFIMGPEVEQLEAEVARGLGVTHALGVSSGTDALVVSMMALDIGPGDEVITPTFSFFATAGSVARLGATPVFVDVDPVTSMMDAAAVRAAMTPRTKAVIPVHLYGLCADMDPLLAVAASQGVPVIEDAAQAIGATYKGRNAGTLSTIGCFSFFPTKNLGAFGDAGLVTTDDDALAARVRRLRNHGAEPKYYHREIGGNFRLDALQAAVLRVKLPHLHAWNENRRANAARYQALFEQAGLTGPRRVRLHPSTTSGCPEPVEGQAAKEGIVRLPVEPPDRFHTYHQYVVRVPERDRVRAHLASRDVATEVYYPVPFHRQECFAPLVAARDAFPEADAAAREVLALPVFPGLTTMQQEHVVSCMAEVLG